MFEGTSTEVVQQWFRLLSTQRAWDSLW